MTTSTPKSFMSAQIAPDAMQSNTRIPPTSRIASPILRIYASGKIIPVDVST